MQNLVNRNLIKSIVLSVITMGFYPFFWFVRLSREISAFEDEQNNGVKEILISLIFPFFGVYLLQKELVNGCETRGIEMEDRSILYMVVSFFVTPIGGAALLQNDVNKLTEKYGEPEIDCGFSATAEAFRANMGGARQNTGFIADPVGSVKYCPRCGSENPSAHNCCAHCGASL